MNFFIELLCQPTISGFFQLAALALIASLSNHALSKYGKVRRKRRTVARRLNAEKPVPLMAQSGHFGVTLAEVGGSHERRAVTDASSRPRSVLGTWRYKMEVVENRKIAAAARFELGQLVATPNALAAISTDDIAAALVRHHVGDWGDVCADDARANEQALRIGARLLSAYRSAKGVKFWIITEANRSATTVLLPEDY